MRTIASRSLHGVSSRGLGVIPIAVAAGWAAVTGAAPASVYAILGGSAAAGIWAWNDPDVFRSLWIRNDVENKMAILNNQWQLLWRAAVSHGLMGTPVMQLLDTRMGQWWDFKKSYDESIIGQLPWVGEDWDGRLETWLTIFNETKDKVAEAGGAKLAEELERRGVDPRVVDPDPDSPDFGSGLQQSIGEALNSLQEQTKSKLFWPIVGAGAFTLAFVWLISRPSRAT